MSEPSDYNKTLRHSLYIDYIQSDAWKLKRATIIKENARCAVCGYNKRLQLHHKHYKTLCYETADDFVILCRACHAKLHGKHEEKKKFINYRERRKLRRDTQRLKKLKKKEARRQNRMLYASAKQPEKFSVSKYHIDKYIRPKRLSKIKKSTEAFYKI